MINKIVDKEQSRVLFIIIMNSWHAQDKPIKYLFILINTIFYEVEVEDARVRLTEGKSSQEQ